MTDDSQEARRGRLSDSSKNLLEAIDDLHALEQSKRDEVISTPAFHELADEIQRKSRGVFAMASDEVDQAEVVETSEVSMNEIGGSHVEDH
jgi:hypothetical protein